MQDQSLTSTQIRTIFYIIKKHKWKTVTLFLVTGFVTAFVALMITPIYRASSRLLVKPGREDVYLSPAPGMPAIVTGPSEKVQSEIAILTSPSLVMQLVNTLGVNRLLTFPDRTLKGWPVFNDWLFKETKNRTMPPINKVSESVEKSLNVSAVSRSNVINVSFEWPDPVIAADVVNTLVGLYMAQHVKVHTDPQTYDLLKKQAEKWKKGLRDSEKEIEDFKRRHSIASLPQQKTILLQKLSEIESRKKQAETEIQETAEMIATLEAQLADLDQKVQLQETVDKQSATLAALKGKLVELELQGLRDEIRRVKQMIAEEEKKEQVVVVSGKSPIRQSLEGDLLRAKARINALEARQKNQEIQTAAYRQELTNFDRFEKQMRELRRQVEINEENYKLYLNKFEQAKISQSMDSQKIASVSVIEPAIPPVKPIKPEKNRVLVIWVCLALLTGFGVPAFIEFINPVFRTREDIDQFLGLPVLATLPREK